MDIEQFSLEELCEAYSVLSSWKWYDGFGKKPEGFDDMPMYRRTIKEKLFYVPTKMDYINPLTMDIESAVPEKELLRYHHIHNLGHTNEEFEEWWTSNKELSNVNYWWQEKGFWGKLKKNHPLIYEVVQWMILAIGILAIAINIISIIGIVGKG